MRIAGRLAMFTVIEGGGERKSPYRSMCVEGVGDIAREIVRSMCVQDPEVPVSRAVHRFFALLEFVERYPELIADLDGIVRQGLLQLSEFDEPRHYVDDELLTLAKRGVRYLVEMSASDGAAASRLSRAHHVFWMAARDFGEVDAAFLKTVREETRAARPPVKRKQRKARKPKRPPIVL